jgi:hypothetical protein
MPERRDEASDASPETGAGHENAAGHAAAQDRELKFELLRNALYHDAREAFLSGASRMIMFLTALAGTAAFGTITAGVSVVAEAAAFGAAALATLGLVFDLGGRARTHQDLRRRFYALLAKAEGGAEPPRLRRAMTMLYAEEPPMMWGVDAMAHNQAARALDYEGRLQVATWRRLLRHHLRFDSRDFPDA